MRAQNIYRKKFTRANILFPENINTEYTKTHILLAQTQLQKLAKPQYMHKQIFVITYQYKRASEASSKNQCARETERATPTDSLRKFFGQHIYEMIYIKEISIDKFEI